MNNHKKAFTLVIVVTAMLGCTITTHAQSTNNSLSGQTGNRFISTGMPILNIAPDAVSSAMGDVGVASVPDANSSHWNNAKFAFMEDKLAVTTTYTPWLRNLQVADMNFLYLAGSYKINQRSTAAASLTYFSLGTIQNTDVIGTVLGDFKPNEFAVDITYSMKLSDNLSLGATGRFMRSDLTNGVFVQDNPTNPANALSADVGLYYQSEFRKQQQYAFGAFVSNIGNKLRYSEYDAQSEFLPTNLRLGGRYTYEINDYNKFTAMVDLNKLLVPTPPRTTLTESEKNHYANMDEYRQLSSFQGIFSSFMDAPGGFKEELQELTLGFGAEYWYANTFAARAGYFTESASKGNRKYLTMGLGIRYNIFNFDLSYLIPTSDFGNNPLANTVRISLTAKFGGNK